MNKYALIAQEHWMRYAPSRYATLENPETYFRTLGESAAAQVGQIAASLERELPQDLPYLERVGQMNAIRLQAEETVLNDLVYSVETENSSLAQELEEMLGDLPSPNAILVTIDQIRGDAEEAGEREASSTPILSEAQERKIAQLTALLPLLTVQEAPETMSEADLRVRILALRPFWDPESRSLNSP